MIATIATGWAAGRTAGPAEPLARAVADTPLDPSRGEASGWALRELAKPAYAEAQPSLLLRLLRWIGEQFARFTAQATSGSPVSAVALGVLAVLVVLVVVLLVRRFGLSPTMRTTGREDLFGDGAPIRSAAEHRTIAEAAAARGDWTLAVLERFRAVVRELEERTLLTERPGRTAHEAAVDAGTALPTLAEQLNVTAQIFDQIRYGGRPGDRQAYDTVAALDDGVRSGDHRQGGVVAGDGVMAGGTR